MDSVSHAALCFGKAVAHVTHTEANTGGRDACHALLFLVLANYIIRNTDKLTSEWLGKCNFVHYLCLSEFAVSLCILTIIMLSFSVCLLQLYSLQISSY